MSDKKRVLFLLLFFIISFSNISALRISPARYNFDFSPNLEKELNFRIDNYKDRQLELFVEGDLKEYVELDKNILPPDGGIFIAKFNLPEKIDIPGNKRTLIGVREVVDEELAAGQIAVAVAIQASVYVDVPYPGKYVESSLVAHDINLNEPLTFNLNIVSKGDKSVNFVPLIEIYSEDGSFIDSLEFAERTMQGGEELKLKKIWDSQGYSRGNYYAISKIDYGDRIAESRSDFRIGDLVIEITNYTNILERDGIKRFLVEIESGWNDRIDGAYADVFISNETNKNILEFRTSPTDLEPWQKKSVRGYINTDELSVGKYNAEIVVSYYGKSVGKTLSKNVKLEIYENEKPNYFLYGLIIFGGLISIIIIFLIIKTVLFKHGKRK